MTEENNNLIKTIINTYKIPLITIGVGILLVIGIAYAAYQPTKDYVTKIIDEFVQQQKDMIMKDYQNAKKEQDDKIADLQRQISVSDQKIANLRGKVKNVEIEIANNKPPVGPVELRDRFNKLGITPVN